MANLRTRDSIPTRYVLYSHLAFEKSDLHYIANDMPISDFPSVRCVSKHISALKSLLDSPPHEGMAILFYGYGYAKLLEEGVRDNWNDPALQKMINAARSVKAEISRIIGPDEVWQHRIRFVTAADLLEDQEGNLGLMKHLSRHADFGKNAFTYLMGDSKGFRYDAPKIPEAIVRLRLSGAGVPVFRLDWDVLFPAYQKESDVPRDLGIFKAIMTELKVDEMRRSDSAVESYMFSGTYDNNRLGDKDSLRQLETWQDALATRVLPCLKVSEKFPVDPLNDESLWDQYAKDNFDPDLAKRFFGFEEVNGRLRVAGRPKGIAKLGAHPTSAIISGALMSMSPTSILDLPPFSNFGLNVVWIDDHLRYALSRNWVRSAVARRTKGHSPKQGWMQSW